ncbi:MAG: Gfo/Idh/MocA family oxidoreductase [Kiritimatiellae bacterium]|nr:Gfo/Idh/MocA family oxidoreductase [Kiritimatiellia bacterium]
MNRRTFLKSGMAAVAAPMIVPRHVLGGDGYTPPSEKITLGGIGIGGIGHPQLKACAEAGFEIVALCDVDDNHAKKTYDVFPQARQYRDFRELLSVEKDRVDAIYCGTPDHTHALITLAALREKKHVCCVKPLTRTLEECKLVVEAAKKVGTATQVTASPWTGETGCRVMELLEAGVIGEIREIHLWSDRPKWPQGMTAYPTNTDPIPATFDWELWQGPAERRPFTSQWAKESNVPDLVSASWGGRAVYHPFNFRGWTAYGTGSLGDMGCHYVNIPYRALKLRYPTRVMATSTRAYSMAYPLASVVTYDFPAREGLPACQLFWYDGGLRPPVLPKELDGQKLPEGGALYIGSKGVMLNDRVVTPACAEKAEAVPKTLVRRGHTFREWLTACKGGEKAGCDFEWASYITDFVLLGNLAIQTGKPVAFDPAAMRVTNNPAADALIRQPYHNGWKLEAV